jgi:hypothetical protein
MKVNPYDDYDVETKGMHFFEAFRGVTKETWTSIFVRYLLRPRKWFVEAMQHAAGQALSVAVPLRKGSISTSASKSASPQCSNTSVDSQPTAFCSKLPDSSTPIGSEYEHGIHEDGNGNESENEYEYVSLPVRAIPKPFVSLHIRYGSKVIETSLMPLTKYMNMVKKKARLVRDIFVSTETESVIFTLAR